MKRFTLLATTVALFLSSPQVLAESGDPKMLTKMQQNNAELSAMGMNIAVEEIKFFTIGKGRPSNRIHQQEFRWVPGDQRRFNQNNDIT